MSKLTKWFLRILGGIIGIMLLFNFVIGPIIKSQTKKHSPEQHITHTQNVLEVAAFYCSPSKKDRKIFGELVSYNEVWRTGANEASTFTTNRDLTINGQLLKTGTYTLWTIPNEKTWQVIFNSEMYGWGVKFTDQSPSRDPKYDILVTEANVSKSLTITENFTISFAEVSYEALIMTIAWDDVAVPLKMIVTY
ncbi:MAG: hypothetical protein ACI9SJ_000093 [Flavobacteriaceae bacterium]|jgi:hypothetical protein|uniref:DUF2911 domain-containing protein n=1 Tax=Candidatus Marifrigoribacter sp. Uisw_064 TaxID=3230970 RepID=UPI003AE2592F